MHLHRVNRLTRTGYTSIKAQLLSVPPYAAAAIVTVTVGFIADRTRQRGICNILVSLVGITGFAMLLGCKTAGARYAGTFLGAMGIYPAISNTIPGPATTLKVSIPRFMNIATSNGMN